MLRPIKLRLRLALPVALLACSTAGDARMPAISLRIGDVSCRLGQPMQEPAPSRTARWQAVLGRRIARAVGAPQMARAYRHGQTRAALMLAGLNTHLKGDL